MKKDVSLIPSAFSMALLLLAAAPLQAVMPSEPVSGWLFDGDLSDTYGGNGGTIVGGGVSYSSDGPFAGGQALDVRGTDGAVNFGNPDNLRITDAITVSTWVNFESSGGYVFNKWDTDSDIRRSWAIRDRGDGQVSVLLSRNGFFSDGNRKEYAISGSINDGDWHHVAFTFEDNQLALYLNGSQVDSPVLVYDDSFDTIYNNDAPVFAGSRGDHPSSLFDGLIGESAIWDGVLGADEISWLSQNSLAAIPEPSTFALLFGVGAFGLVVYRRRNRR